MAIALLDSGTYSTTPGGEELLGNWTNAGPCAYVLMLKLSGLGSESVDVRMQVGVLDSGVVVFVDQTFAGAQDPPGWESGPLPSADGSLFAYFEQATGSSVDIDWAVLRLS